MPNTDKQSVSYDSCNLNKIIKILSGTWTPQILWTLSRNGLVRHGELKRLLGDISSKVLTDRLRMLEREQIVFRDHEPTIPPRVSYGLTEAGEQLDQALRLLEDVAARWA